MGILTGLDTFIFFGSMILVMGVGLWAGREEETSEDYYLAGRSTKWWGVAGSIFGSNVSANHIVGMMGVGFSVGFAQSHFEISAIAGLLVLCYAFLPVYRKLNVYTLSDYLGQRFDDRARVAYALIMVFIIVFVMMVPGFYIGSRFLNILLQDAPGDIAVTGYRIGIISMAVITGAYVIFGGLKAVIMTDVIQSVLMLVGASIVAYLTFSQDVIGGWAGMLAIDSGAEGGDKMHLYLPSDHPVLPWSGVLTGLMVLHFYYWGANQFIVQRALSTRTGREARLGIVFAGFFKLVIPFLSIGTGIAAYYYFQAESLTVDQDAAFPMLMKHIVAPVGCGLLGLVAAGLIGAILSSLDSMMNSASTIITFDFYKRYFNKDASDATLILVGRVTIVVLITLAAGLTILTMDPNSKGSFFLHVASYQSKVIAGIIVALAMGMFWKRATPAAGGIVIVAGVIFSFAVGPMYDGMIGKQSGAMMEQSLVTFDAPHHLSEGDQVMLHKSGAIPVTLPVIDVSSVLTVVLSDASSVGFTVDGKPLVLDNTGTEASTPVALPVLYKASYAGIVSRLGVTMNFMHTAMIAAVLCVMLMVGVSLGTTPDPEKSKLTWLELGGHKPGALKAIVGVVCIVLAGFAVIGWLMARGSLSPLAAACLSAFVTWAVIVRTAFSAVARARSGGGDEGDATTLIGEDRFWASFLAATAVFMLYYFK